MPGNFVSGIAAFRDLLDGFDLELFGVTCAAHGPLLKSDFLYLRSVYQARGDSPPFTVINGLPGNILAFCSRAC
jgi:hypothetical protein